MKFTLEIELGNHAMETLAEVSRSLAQSANSAQNDPFRRLSGGESSALRDINGNTVGKWEVVATAGDPHAHIGVGHCEICGHYGQDCTGTL